MNRVVVPAAALAAVALAGCGSSSSSPARPSPSSAGASSAPVASANLNGEQAKPAQQVLADAKSALFNAPSVHVKGTQTQAGKSQKLDVQFQGEDAAGTITIAGIPLNIVKTAGKVYVKAPAPFWVKTVGATVAPKLANRWLEQDAAKAGNATTLTLQGVAASLNSDAHPSNPPSPPPTSTARKPSCLPSRTAPSSPSPTPARRCRSSSRQPERQGQPRAR